MNISLKRLTGILLMTVTLVFASQVLGQDLRANLFAAIDAQLVKGKELRADVLAPKSWGKAMEKYNTAERKLTDGKNLDDIRKELTQASGFFKDAIKATDLARVSLASPLKARDDAVKAEAPQSASELWQLAEAKFAEAGRKLEEGNVNDSRKKGTEAEAIFRDAELAAIKTSFFDETRKLLARADAQKVDKFAPITLARSRKLLSQAETALNENRYDSDRPRSLAMDARYEALHALHLAKVVKMIDDKIMTREEILLKAEEPLAQIGGALDVPTAFDEVTGEPVEEVGVGRHGALKTKVLGGADQALAEEVCPDSVDEDPGSQGVIG